MALEAPIPPRPTVPSGLGERHGFVVGMLVACAALAVAVGAGPYPHQRGLRILFALVACGLIVALRRWPVPMLAVAVGAAALEIVAGSVSLPCGAVVGLATFVVASRLTRRRSVRVALGAVLGLGAALVDAALALRGQVAAAEAVVSLVPLVAGWFVGDAVTARRRYLEGLAVQAERERRAEVDRAHLEVRQERVRIARELHDVVAHTLAVITVQAGVGRRLMDRRPDEAAEALRSIEEIGRTAQDELRVVLGLLRDEEIERASLAPAPRLVDLKELVDTVQASGTPVVLRTRGAETVPSPAMELTIYRVVQEALTNVVKHAPGAAVTVDVAAGTGEITVDVRDDGGPAAPLGPGDGPGDGPGGWAGPGHGIAGMRERVGAFGGSLEAGEVPGGGFRVLARIPVDAP